MTRPTFHIEAPAELMERIGNAPGMHDGTYQIMPQFRMQPGFHRDTFKGQAAKWWSGKPVKSMQLSNLAESALMPMFGIGPKRPEQWAAQITGEVDRMGWDRVQLEELALGLDEIAVYPAFVYSSFEDQGHCEFWPDNDPRWLGIEALTGHPKLPRNLRYTGKFLRKKITSLAAYLKQRTEITNHDWQAFFQPRQAELIRRVWQEGPLGSIPLVMYNHPNFGWVEVQDWHTLDALRIAPRSHLSMYLVDQTTDEQKAHWLSRWDAALEHEGPLTVTHLRPDEDEWPQLDLLKTHFVRDSLIFFSATDPLSKQYSEAVFEANMRGLERLRIEIHKTW